ncbi:RNA polymerase sigma factor [Phenylobacterium sp.]|uniref:RNA polymerase sigma factor n=1 Tax=Phenylobacterium sp. TaxID=1871053 RepID=UPI002DE98067|nr:RNA polymerase sigma factor [Phenylobacterium sp.]
MRPSSLAAVEPGPEPAADGDLDSLYRRHGPWLARMLRLRFGREAAEDLAQEAFLRAAPHLRRGIVLRPRAFLLRIAFNAARDEWRKSATRPSSFAGDPDQQAEPGAGSEQLEALLLKQVILGLPPRVQEVFLLSRFGGLTYEEIGERCGVSVKTVEWRMTKALAICAAKLRG